jgi:Domain of unknown function (DUF3387)
MRPAILEDHVERSCLAWLAALGWEVEDGLQRYRNRAIKTARMIEELIEMARKFQEAALHGERLGELPRTSSLFGAAAVCSSISKKGTRHDGMGLFLFFVKIKH